MKALEFIYQDTEIHFLVNPNDKNVMINATEMAKPFNKRIDVFLKTQPTKEFIELLKFPPTGVNLEPILEENIIQTKGRSGTFFHRELAIEFAMWLDPIFKRWIIAKIDEVLFGNYKKHWDAHVKQEDAKNEMEDLKSKLISNPTAEEVVRYFHLEQIIKNCSAEKMRAIKDQYRLELK